MRVYYLVNNQLLRRRLEVVLFMLDRYLCFIYSCCSENDVRRNVILSKGRHQNSPQKDDKNMLVKHW